MNAPHAGAATAAPAPAFSRRALARFLQVTHRKSEQVMPMPRCDDKVKVPCGSTEGADRQVTFTGVVRPLLWDQGGETTEVEIKPSGRFEVPGALRVDPDGVGRELTWLLFETVTVSGYVVTDPYGARSLYVTGYKLAEGEAVRVPFEPPPHRWDKRPAHRPKRAAGGERDETRRAFFGLGRAGHRRHRRPCLD